MRKTVASLYPPVEFRPKLPKPEDKERQDEIRPVDRWEDQIPSALLSMASDYRILLAPLFGQEVGGRTDGNWCGCTSAACVYNFRQLKDLDPKIDPMTKYITMRSIGARMEITNPDKSKAWPQADYGQYMHDKFGYIDALLDDFLVKSEITQRRNDPEWVMEVFKKGSSGKSVGAFAGLKPL